MRLFFLVGLLIAACGSNAADGERLSATNLDFRTTLFFRVTDGAVQKLLPSGWEVNSPSAGPTAGMNLAIILVDNLMSLDADGKPTPTHRGAIVIVPVKKSGAKSGGVMIVRGLMSEGNSPGAYGVYAPARVDMETTLRGSGNNMTVEESWSISGTDGTAIHALLHYARGPMTRVDREVIANGVNEPDSHRIYRYDSASDTLKSAPAGIDRVRKLEFKASGPQLAPIFDGSHTLLAVISTPWYLRRIFLPLAQ